jgi:hypothetical protein
MGEYEDESLLSMQSGTGLDLGTGVLAGSSIGDAQLIGKRRNDGLGYLLHIRKVKTV